MRLMPNHPPHVLRYAALLTGGVMLLVMVALVMSGNVPFAPKFVKNLAGTLERNPTSQAAGIPFYADHFPIYNGGDPNLRLVNVILPGHPVPNNCELKTCENTGSCSNPYIGLISISDSSGTNGHAARVRFNNTVQYLPSTGVFQSPSGSTLTLNWSCQDKVIRHQLDAYNCSNYVADGVVYFDSAVVTGPSGTLYSGTNRIGSVQVPFSGSVGQTFNYTLTCQRKTNSWSASVSARVMPPAPIISITGQVGASSPVSGTVNMTVGQSVLITGTFAAASGDSLTATALNDSSNNALPGVPNTTNTSPKSYTFTPTTAGTYIFYPAARTTLHPAWNNHGSALTVQVAAAPSGFTLTVESNDSSAVAIGGTSGYTGTTNYNKVGIANGTSVQLIAPATTDTAYFSGWNNCNSGSGTTCTVIVNSSKTVTANFGTGGYTLTVNTSGASGISISGSPALTGGTTNYVRSGIPGGSVIVLTAPSTSGTATFSSWSGCTSASGVTCNITMTGGNKTVTASYTATDLCPSLSGTQTSYPSGSSPANSCTCPSGYTYNSVSNTCVAPATDLCPSLAGTQTSYPSGSSPANSCTCPSGYTYDSGSNACVAPDLCPSLAGTQTSYPSGSSPVNSCTCPSGYTYNSGSNACVVASDSCTTMYPSYYGPVVVTGTTAGTVYGSGPYHFISTTAKAAVHAGIISVGQTATIMRTSAGTVSSFTGSTQNGITSFTTGSSACGVTLSNAAPSIPTLTLASTQSAAEGGSTGIFTVTANQTSSSNIAVNYTVTGGTATQGTDYTSLSGSVTLPANQTSVTIPVSAINDTEYEGTETIGLALSSSSSYDRGSPYTATMNLIDNETAASLPTFSTCADTGTPPTCSLALLSGLTSVNWIRQGLPVTVSWNVDGLVTGSPGNTCTIRSIPSSAFTTRSWPQTGSTWVGTATSNNIMQTTIFTLTCTAPNGIETTTARTVRVVPRFNEI